jgi:L-ascorbate metabolism protein UlaG (beta-lactamase superfamily)
MITPVQKDDDFLTDFHEADKVSGAIHVWWLGQSGFLLKWAGHGLLIDPYLSDSLSRKTEGTTGEVKRISERVVDPLQLTGVDLVVCSNTDPDRLDPETILPLRAANPTLKVVLPAGAAAFAKSVSASLAVPCHYDLFDRDNAIPDEFSSCCERLGQRFRLLKIGQRLTMGPITDPSAGKALPSEPYQSDWGLGY